MAETENGGKGSDKGSSVRGCLSGCGVFVLLAVGITAVVFVIAMQSDTAASTHVNVDRVSTVQEILRMRIVSSVIFMVVGGFVGLLIGILAAALFDRFVGRNTRDAERQTMPESPHAASHHRSVDHIAAIVAFTIIGAGYGLVGTVVNARALAAGPVAVQVGRPAVTTEAKTDDDDATYYECAMDFTVTATGKVIHFPLGNCLEGSEQPDPNSRLAHDLQGVGGDKLVLEYYDAFIWPVYSGVRADPAHS